VYQYFKLTKSRLSRTREALSRFTSTKYVVTVVILLRTTLILHLIFHRRPISPMFQCFTSQNLVNYKNMTPLLRNSQRISFSISS